MVVGGGRTERGAELAALRRAEAAEGERLGQIVPLGSAGAGLGLQLQTRREEMRCGTITGLWGCLLHLPRAQPGGRAGAQCHGSGCVHDTRKVPSCDKM